MNSPGVLSDRLALEGTGMSVDRFKLLAAYNKWANARLYTAALELSETSYRLTLASSSVAFTARLITCCSRTASG